MASTTLAAAKRAMGRIAPLNLASSWDNVGLLVESPINNPSARQILLTIDLTPAVLEEALNPAPTKAFPAPQTGVIIAYHPTLFKPLRSLTLSNPNSLQTTLLRCVASGISVYSPHTALDVVKGGVNDWLADSLLRNGVQGTISQLGDLKELEGSDEKVGQGRLVNFANGLGIDELVSRVKGSLELEHVQLARSPSGPSQISSVALCAGSGGSVIGDARADVYFTGEMSHHEILAANAANTHVILCGHTNTERPYLKVLKGRLEKELSDEGPNAEYEVVVSKADKHPLCIV